jgi:hypothetical protein
MSLAEDNRPTVRDEIATAPIADERALIRSNWRYTRSWRTPDGQAQWHEAVPKGVAPLWLLIERVRCDRPIALASAPKPYVLLRRLLTSLSRRR